jgi:nicotinate phosphoribosyltransferase
VPYDSRDHTPAIACHSVMLTDLYELTMAAAYFACKFQARASFELFVRGMPRGRSYLIFTGLEQALDFLEDLRFKPQDIDYLRAHAMFSRVPTDFFDYLRELRFTGDVWAMPEGTPFFAQEPVLRVTAPIVEAQIVETYLLASIAFPTLVATKAARLVEAAQGRSVVEFGTRRAHGPEAGVLAARASYIGGCVGTSNVEAGQRFGIPTFGTIAHSFIMAYGDEEDAFRRFTEMYPQNSTLLIDTYDTLRAVDKIIAMGLRPTGVRIDSGNIADITKEVRRRLDAAGLRETIIFASGDLDEFIITRLLAQQAPIDYFAVGTALSTSKDAPSLGAVYKLVQLIEEERGATCATEQRVSSNGRPIAETRDAKPESGNRTRYAAKFAEGKITYPGDKQVFRFLDNECAVRDVIGRAEESFTGAQPLLQQVLRNGKRCSAVPALNEVKEHCARSLKAVPLQYRELSQAAAYPVSFSNELKHLLETVKHDLDSTIARREGR